MSVLRLFFIGSLAVFGLILVAGVTKKAIRQRAVAASSQVQEIALEPTPAVVEHRRVNSTSAAPVNIVQHHPSEDDVEQDSIDRTALLFNPGGPHLPIVQTIRYSPHVSWVKDRMAWVVDYASHYQTSKHFISRSLTGKREYFTNEINTGDRFNVLRNDINFEFYLLVDIARCKMRFYYTEPAKKEMVLIKTYPVVLGRLDDMSPSGCLTPLGKYRLGSRIAVYKPGMMGTFHKQKTEMIQIFGTRWIPFEEEISGCSAPARGYGVHGYPWAKATDNSWSESKDASVSYSSDGCIRVATADMEELFAIIVTRPTTIEIVRNFEHASLDARLVEPSVMMMNP